MKLKLGKNKTCMALAALALAVGLSGAANGASILLTEIANGNNGVAGGGDDLTGTLVFRDVSTDGTLAVVAGTGTGLINAGDSGGNNWGRADASKAAGRTTTAGNTDALGGTILEHRSNNVAAPDLMWTVNLTANTTYNMFLHYLTNTVAGENWGGNFGIAHDGTNITSATVFDSSVGILVTNTGAATTSFRRLAAGTVTTDGSGNAVLYISRGTSTTFVGSRTLLDGVVFQPVPEPSTALLGLGGLALLISRRRR